MIKKLTIFILILSLTLTFLTACSSDNEASSAQSVESEDPVTTLGVGNTSFIFTSVRANGNTFRFTVMTNKKTVSEALLQYQLITFESNGNAKTVFGEPLDKEKGEKWVFYINDEPATTTPDKTPVTKGYEYTFKIES